MAPIPYGGNSASLNAIANSPISPPQAMNLLIEAIAPDLRLQGARTIRAMVAAQRVREVRQTRQDWIVRGGGATSGIFPVLDETTLNETDTTHKAFIEFGEYKVSHRMRVNRIQLQEAQQRGADAIKDLFAEEVYSGLRKIHQDMNRILYKGDGTPAYANVQGLDYAYTAAGTYEGISPLDLPQWQPLLLDNAGTPQKFTRDLMRDYDTFMSLEEAGYNFVIMHPDTAKAYSAEYDNIAGTLNAQGRAAGANANAELGYQGKTFNGLQILEDPEARRDLIYTLDINTLTLPFFVLDNNPATPNVNPIAINRTFGFPIHIAELPSAVSTVRHVEMYTMPYLRVTNRRALSGIGNIDPDLTFAEAPVA